MLKDAKLVIANIQDELARYIENNRIENLVVGVSGGIDSALCLALAFDVCRKTGAGLIGRSITIETNKEEEITRAKKTGNAFCSDFKEVNLTQAYKDFYPNAMEEEEVTDDVGVKIRKGNIKARMRMIYLYDLAQKNRGMVLSTDNFTEYLLGFWTLHGDVGDYGMIQNLWKTEVYMLADYLKDEFDRDKYTDKADALDLTIKAVPTDGLGITDSDLDQIQAKTYEEVDNILIEYLERGNAEYKEHPVVQRYERTHFKRLNPLNIQRDKLLKV